MPKKLHAVEKDILSLLQKNEPDMLLWREIKARLWPLYRSRYKDEKVFGVALSNYLTRQEDKLWKHEGDYWGTPKSSPPPEKENIAVSRRDTEELFQLLEQKLGSDVDLGGLLFRVQSVNNLMKSGARVSSQQAEEIKDEIESDIEFVRCGVKEDGPQFAEKETLLNAFRDHLKLAVDSLVRQ